MWSFRKEIHKIQAGIIKFLMCGESLNLNGDSGVYYTDIEIGEEVGTVSIAYYAGGLPDRFEIIYDTLTEEDSLYVGNQLLNYFDDLVDNPFNDVPVLEYNGASYQPTGATETINNTNVDISSGTLNTTRGAGILYFDKTTSAPSTVTLRTLSPLDNTSWLIESFCTSTVGGLHKPVMWGSGTQQASGQIANSDSSNLFNDYIFFIAEDENINTVTNIYTDQEGTTLAPPNFYSNGGDWVEWDGTSIIDSGIVTSPKLRAFLYGVNDPSGSSATACGLVLSYNDATNIAYHNGVSYLPTNGDIVYINSENLTTLNGGNDWYQVYDPYVENTYAIQVDATGEVIDTFSCP